MDALLKSH